MPVVLSTSALDVGELKVPDALVGSGVPWARASRVNPQRIATATARWSSPRLTRSRRAFGCRRGDLAAPSTRPRGTTRHGRGARSSAEDPDSADSSARASSRGEPHAMTITVRGEDDEAETRPSHPTFFMSTSSSRKSPFGSGDRAARLVIPPRGYAQRLGCGREGRCRKESSGSVFSAESSTIAPGRLRVVWPSRDRAGVRLTDMVISSH